MIDREKVIKGLECCIRLNSRLDERDCDDCPYNYQSDGTCASLSPLLDDVQALLKADQTYLQEQDEKIKKLHLLLNTQLSLADQTKKELEDEIARLNRELDAMNRLSEMQMDTLKEQEDSVPLKPLAEWLAGYAAPPRNVMLETAENGHITSDTLTKAWEKVLGDMR